MKAQSGRADLDLRQVLAQSACQFFQMFHGERQFDAVFSRATTRFLRRSYRAEQT